MDKECFICKEQFYNKICECCFGYAHYSCLDQWINTSYNFNCTICKKKYNISFCYKMNKYLKYYIKEIYEFWEFIGEHNIYTGVRWDDY